MDRARRGQASHEPPSRVSTKRRSFFGFAALVFLSCGSAVEAAPNEYRLLADTGAAISSVAISLNSARRTSLRNAELVTHLLQRLPGDIRFTVLSDDPGVFTDAAASWPPRIKLLEESTPRPLTIWTQDPFLVLTSRSGTTRLLMARQFDRSGDAAMAKQIAASHGFEIIASELDFDGGNIVSDESFAFVGANTVRLNAQRRQLHEVAIAERFESELGRNVLVVGPYPQPVGHIDMLLTPLGRKRIALADAGAGAAIAMQALTVDAAEVLAFETAAEENFFGLRGVESLALPNGSTVTPPKVKHQTAAMIEASIAMAAWLDRLATSLAQNFGYQVVRIPFLVGGPRSERRDAGVTESNAAYPMLSYNNVLIEEAKGTQIVYLPRYGLAALDAAAESAWTAAGFRVRAVEGLTTSAMHGGSLRCSVKVLAR